jgi:hypothetical protein
MKRGGYLGARQSTHIQVVPHFLWSSTRQFWWGYVPIRPLHGWRVLAACLWFRGRVRLEVVARRPPSWMDESEARHVTLL